MAVKQPSKRTLLCTAAPPKNTTNLLINHINKHALMAVTQQPNNPCCFYKPNAALTVVVAWRLCHDEGDNGGLSRVRGGNVVEVVRGLVAVAVMLWCQWCSSVKIKGVVLVVTVVGTKVEKWRLWCRGYGGGGWRVVKSYIWDQIDRKTGIFFGFAGKVFRWRRVVVAGRRCGGRRWAGVVVAREGE
nr:hypothetical protein [Tanacetum cinerariifolium]